MAGDTFRLIMYLYSLPHFVEQNLEDGKNLAELATTDEKFTRNRPLTFCCYLNQIVTLIKEQLFTVGVFILTSVLHYYLPTIEPIVRFVLNSLLYSMWIFAYKWSHHPWEDRVQFISRSSSFYIGFGFLIYVSNTFLTHLISSMFCSDFVDRLIISYIVYSTTAPFFVISSSRAKPVPLTMTLADYLQFFKGLESFLSLQISHFTIYSGLIEILPVSIEFLLLYKSLVSCFVIPLIQCTSNKCFLFQHVQMCMSSPAYLWVVLLLLLLDLIVLLSRILLFEN